jgi:drug/metabolite transporter (DMT)-like permease
MNLILFLTTAFIWGTTWIAIKYQLGIVHPLWSLTYRFGIASLILMIICALGGYSLKFSMKDHCRIALQAVFLFSINYLFFYIGTDYFVSGIVAVLFASITMMNILNSRLFLSIPLSLSAFIGSFLGIIGLVCIFSTEVIRLCQKDLSYILEGLVLCLGGTLWASFGQTLATSNIRHSLPVMQTNAFGMAYGSFITSGIAVFMGIPATFDFSMSYMGSLIYLSLFGTVLAFGTYLKLVGNIGPGRASYAFVLIPLIALIISSFFEGYNWDKYSLAGVSMVVMGNLIVLSRNVKKVSKPLPVTVSVDSRKL